MQSMEISVVIPTYNRYEFTVRAIESVLGQTKLPDEILVVDNCSDDGSIEKLMERYKSNALVRIFKSEKNNGPVKNWIKGVEMAQGEYISILFSDDEYYPTFVEEMSAPLKDPRVGISTCAARKGPNSQSPRLVVYQDIIRPSLVSARLYLTLQTSLHGKGFLPLSLSAIMMRRRDFVKNLRSDFPGSNWTSFSENGAGPDLLAPMLTMKSYPWAYVTPHPLVHFREHNSSISVINEGNKVTGGYAAALEWFRSTD